MIYYAVKIKSFPRIKFAFSLITDKYKIDISKPEYTIEICHISGGSYRSFFDGREFVVPNNSITVIMPDAEVVNRAVDDSQIRFLDIAIEVDDIEFEKFECEAKADWDSIKEKYNDRIILPFFLDFEKTPENILKLFYQIIQDNLNSSAGLEIKSVGYWCELISAIDFETRKRLDADNEWLNTSIYLKKIKSYIERNYNKKITIEEIANVLQISPSYFCRIFKENIGETFVNYVNKTRVNKARELLALYPERSAEEIALAVGFCDLRYMNMMFKRYYGLNVSNCRKIDRELSLFDNNKPWEAKNTDKDKVDTESNDEK